MRLTLLVALILLFNCCSEKPSPELLKLSKAVYNLNEGHDGERAYYYISLNDIISADSEYYELFSRNEFIFRYLQWNLIDSKIVDQIRYSNEDLDIVRSKFYKMVATDKITRKNLNRIVFPKNENVSVSIDSLASIASKLFFAKYIGDDRIQWTICAGKGLFPEVYGIEESYNSVVLQAFCFQAIHDEGLYGDNESLFIKFDQYISEISPLLYDVEDFKIEKVANSVMWEEMSDTPLLKEILKKGYLKYQDDLYFNLEN